ncbi:uncharacterized protein LOC144158070 [Haemaphysalis longicornis]
MVTIVTGTPEQTKVQNTHYPSYYSERKSLQPCTRTYCAQIVRRMYPMIQKIEWEIKTGRELERNLTSICDILVEELEATEDAEDRRQIRLRLDKITPLLTQVHKRTDDLDVRFRTFLSDVSTGKIRSEKQSQTLLQAIWSSYHLSLKDILRHASGFLKHILIGVGGAAANFGMGVIDFYRLKYKPAEVALDALTRSGSFRKPIRGIIGRR